MKSTCLLEHALCHSCVIISRVRIAFYTVAWLHNGVCIVKENRELFRYARSLVFYLFRFSYRGLIFSGFHWIPDWAADSVICSVASLAFDKKNMILKILFSVDCLYSFAVKWSHKFRRRKCHGTGTNKVLVDIERSHTNSLIKHWSVFRNAVCDFYCNLFILMVELRTRKWREVVNNADWYRL